MSHPAADIPIAIDRVDRTRGGGEDVRLRLTGHWTGPGSAHTGDEPLLVISIDGRRHRFPPVAPAADAAPPPPGAWEAVFNLPTWAEPRLPGQAALWVGDAVIPVPPPGELPASAPAPSAPAPGVDPSPAPAAPRPPIARLPAPWALGEAAPWPPEGWAAASGHGPGAAIPGSVPGAGDPLVDTGRTGPLAELLFKESLTALHGELERSSAEAARLRGELADTRAELEARSRMQSSVEAAQAELRGELARLSAAATRQREESDARAAELARRLREVEEQLAAAEAERARAREQAEQARAQAREELERERERSRRELESERRRVRAELEAERSNLAERSEAERARAFGERDAARAEADELRRRLESVDTGRREHDGELAALREQLALAHVTRDSALSEASGLRSELERLGTELAVAREQLGARGGDLAETERLLADARALTEQLRGETPH